MINVKYLPTKEMILDTLTKPLNEFIVKLVKFLGLRRIINTSC